MMSLFSWAESFFSNNIVILPIAICLLMAPVMLFLREKPKVQKTSALFVSALLLILSVFLFLMIYKNGILVYDMGNTESTALS